MYQSYALTFTAVTLRVELGLLQFASPLSFAESYLIVPWLGWVANLIFVDWVLLPCLQARSSNA